MRKLLGLIGAFVLTASASSPMMACSRPISEPTYNTVTAAIKALNLTSYVMNGTIIDNTSAVSIAIRNDAVNILRSNNYVTGIEFDGDDLRIFKVINVKTDKALVLADLVNDTVLSLQLTFIYSKEQVEGASSQLNITIKTDQEIVDYINGYNFSKFISKWHVPVGITLEKFKADVEKGIIPTLGSFSNLITAPTSWKINTLKKGSSELISELIEDDFNQAGKLRIIINYKYAEIDSQNISFNVNMKIDISTVKVVSYEDLTITLPDTSKNSLTEAAVDKIKTEITTAIQTTLIQVPALSTITLTDYEVTGIEDVVKKNADFTNQTEIFLKIIAKSDSAKFIGKLPYQTIQVTVIDKT